MAIDRGDDRLLDLQAARESTAEMPVDLLPAQRPLAIARDQGLEIGAGGEGLVAGASEDSDLQRGISVEAAPGPSQLGIGRGIERVHRLRPVDGHLEKRTCDSVDDGHLLLLYLCKGVNARSWPRMTARKGASVRRTRA